ncbi:MAG: heme ABC exporter ATP-binding protein CcmA [Propylenella sp.]
MVLEARDLSCSRGGRPVFDGISFRVARGELLAVTGPNGAGKSSLLRLIAGLLRPDSGSIACEGQADDEPVTHYLGHADALKPALTLAETLRFWGVLYRPGGVVVETDRDEAAERVGLGHALRLPVGVLSAGQRRRAALARLILAPRPLWLLDEPSASLDSDGEELLARLMRDHIGHGGLIVAATHQALPIAPDSVLKLGAG